MMFKKDIDGGEGFDWGRASEIFDIPHFVAVLNLRRREV